METANKQTNLFKYKILYRKQRRIQNDSHGIFR